MKKIYGMNNNRNKKKYNKNKFKLIFILFLILVLIISLSIISTYSRYRSKTSSDTTLGVAFYVTNVSYQVKTIQLSDIEPDDTEHEYTFTVANNENGTRTETNLTYDVTLKITTNLPLKYDLQMNGAEAIDSDEIKKDDDGTYFRYIKTKSQEFGYGKDQENEYKIIITFPKEYKDVKYQDIIEAIEIQVESKQKI